mmetsp:Transcript_4487/g.13464  ORF Transcript_4487/g.13464 Transcript_4487/m.13464 type:complete len:222 (+) Transcript_4487:256-921(+)
MRVPTRHHAAGAEGVAQGPAARGGEGAGVLRGGRVAGGGRGEAAGVDGERRGSYSVPASGGGRWTGGGGAGEELGGPVADGAGDGGIPGSGSVPSSQGRAGQGSGLVRARLRGAACTAALQVHRGPRASLPLPPLPRRAFPNAARRAAESRPAAPQRGPGGLSPAHAIRRRPDSRHSGSEHPLPRYRVGRTSTPRYSLSTGSPIATTRGLEAAPRRGFCIA